MSVVIHFIEGGGMDETAWAAEGAALRRLWPQSIPGAFTILAYHYTDDVLAAIQAAQSKGRCILCGHSFGACKAWQVAGQLAALGWDVHLVLFDPVLIPPPDSNWAQANTQGFAMPAGVTEAVAYVRHATFAPFSGVLVGTGNYRNVAWTTPDTDAKQAWANHGNPVWDAPFLQRYIAPLVAGGSMLPPVAPPAPPAPAPAPRSIIRVRIDYSDGTADVRP